MDQSKSGPYRLWRREGKATCGAKCEAIHREQQTSSAKRLAALAHGVDLGLERIIADGAADHFAGQDVGGRAGDAERVAKVRLDPEIVAEHYRSGAIGVLDVIRQYAVILDWGTGALLPKSTSQFREVFERRSVAKWSTG